MILVAYITGLGGVRPAMAPNRAFRGAPACPSRQEWNAERASDPRRQNASATQAETGAPVRRIRIRFRARRADEPHRLSPAHPAPRGGRQDVISHPPAHAEARLRLSARQRWPRYPRVAASRISSIPSAIPKWRWIGSKTLPVICVC
jgi:hypothetical protein